MAVGDTDPAAGASALLAALMRACGAEAGWLDLPNAPAAWPRIAHGTGGTAASGCRAGARWVLESNLPLLVGDLGSDARAGVGEELLPLGFRSYLCHPLHAAGRSLGSAHLAATAADHFGDRALEFLARGARVLSLLLEAGRQRAEAEALAEERAREVAVLLEASRALGHVTRPGEIPDLVMETLPRIADLDLGVILVEEMGGWQMTVHQEVPVAAEMVRSARQAAQEGLRPLVVLDPAAIRFQDAASPSLDPPSRARPWRSVLHAPLRRRGGPAGIICLFAARTGAFGEPARRVLTTLASQVSLTLDRLETVRDEQRTHLESVVDAMGDGLIWLDPAGRLRLANPAGRRALDDLVPDPQAGTIHRLGDLDLHAVRLALRAGGGRFQAEVRSARGRRAFALTASPVGGPRCDDDLVILLSDVTEQLRMKEQLLQTEKLSALGEMISGVAHELNNPLAAVMGYAQLLDGSAALPAEVQRRVRAINQEAMRCQRIVHSLLSFARHHRPERAPVDLNGVVRSVIQLIEYPLRVEGVDVSLDLSADLPAVLGDAHQLQQVVLNLLNNAHHAIQDAGRPGRLQVTTALRGERVMLGVTDNGVGIPPGHLRRVFDPFFTTKAVGKGTGLGLSLAYGCITEHGGEIRVESQPGEWTRFTIDLPAHAGAPTAVTAEVIALPQQAPAAARDILVVDDEIAITEVMAEVLAADGHRVDVVHDARQARERLRHRRYDLVITDLKMPHLSGRELHEAVSREDPAMGRRFLFATGDTVSQDTNEFLRRTGATFLAKPFRLRDLQEAVARALADPP